MSASDASKKRPATENGCPVLKKAAKDTAAWPAPTMMPGVPGWQYPPLPIGMIPPMPFCVPGNPFFPLMGMFPPFWLPAAAMAAAAMPAFAAASAAGAVAVPNMTTMPLPATSTMWPGMACSSYAPATAVPATVVEGPVLTGSEMSSGLAVPSTSCTTSVPTLGLPAPASPPPLAASPGSVCNGSSERPPEDDEFADFIDSFLRDEDTEVSETAISSGMKFQVAGFESCDGSKCSDVTADGAQCLTRSDSLLTLLGPDLGIAEM